MKLKEPALRISIDGAARGNPGPAGVGVFLSDASGRRVGEISLYLGEATNNVAESMALIVALQEAVKRGAREVLILTDSQLLSRQVSGDYRVRDRELQWLHVLIQNLIKGLKAFEIRHIPRTQNKQADRLANKAVTEGLKRHAAPRKNPTPTTASSAGQPTFWDQRGVI